MLNLTRIWIWLSALFIAAGWILSSLHALNRVGYGIVCVVAVGGLILWWWRKAHQQRNKTWEELRCKFRRRFKRPAALLFLILAALILAGGALYSPSNTDSTAYRIPRVLHWLGAEHWHWIRTLDARMNIAGCGFEWLNAPLILFTRTDRFLFLINWVPFLLLPGLIFSVFTKLQIPGRVAWWWMWLLPSGWCFIMQAGSTLNDCFGVVYALAAVDFGLRAAKNGRVSELWLALLAAALVTGSKQTLIPLALPGLIAIYPSLKLLLRRWTISVASLGIAGICLVVSVLPITICNLENTGKWIGVPNAWDKTQLNSPFWGIFGNTFCMALGNFKPPVFPFVGQWDAARKHFLQTPLGSHFLQFEDFGQLTFGTGEASAGIGSGVCLLILISIFAARHYQKKRPASQPLDKTTWQLWLLRWVPWGLLLIFMAKIGAAASARQAAAYYIFLFPSLLGGVGQTFLVRRRWWQGLALAVMGLAALVLVISRDRPLFPAQTILSRLQAKKPNSTFVARLVYTYSLVPEFQKQRDFLEQVVPPGEKVVGVAIVERTAETPLWFPFGVRKVERILPDDTPEQLLQERIHYVVVEDDYLSLTNETIEQWVSSYQGTVATHWDIFMGINQPEQHGYLVRLGNGR